MDPLKETVAKHLDDLKKKLPRRDEKYKRLKKECEFLFHCWECPTNYDELKEFMKSQKELQKEVEPLAKSIVSNLISTKPTLTNLPTGYTNRYPVGATFNLSEPSCRALASSIRAAGAQAGVSMRARWFSESFLFRKSKCIVEDIEIIGLMN